MVMPKRRAKSSNVALVRGLAIKALVALVILNFGMDTIDLFSIEGKDDADERILLSAEDMFDAGGKVSNMDAGDRLPRKSKESALEVLHKQEKERKRRIKMMEMEKNVEVEEPYKVIDVSSWAKPSSDYVVDTRDLWESEDIRIPRWMIDYFRWNKEFVTGSDWETTSDKLPPGEKFLYVTCLKDYHKCGGTADRLSSLPFLLKVAASSRRHLLIQWNKPAALEEFLRPPLFGLDWRVPATKEQALQKVGFKVGTQDTILEAKEQSVLQVKFQSNDHGSKYYDSLRESDDEPKFKNVFHTVWDIVFTPSPALALEIEKTMAVVGLVPGGYSSAHLRALYDSEKRSDHVLSTWARNAVNCAYYLQHHQRKNLPIYFASDSELAVAQAQSYGKASGLTVLSYQLANSTGKNPLHLDKAEDWQKKHPRDFFDTFVDLYMMSLGVGVSHGVGGFGYFASLMSNNSTNVVRHMSAAYPFACPAPPRSLRKRRGMNKYRFKKEEPNGDTEESLFRSAMPELHLDSAVHHNKRLIFHANSHGGPSAQEKEYPDFSQSIPSVLWTTSKRMPKWMKDYFFWHREQRALINETNWLKYKYLVVTCFRETSSCGDTAERLRPIPFFVLAAAETKRVLLILWENPARLEEFLMPPRGGVDWRTPSYMVEKLRESGETALTAKQLLKLSNGNERIVKSVVKEHEFGSKYYNMRALSSGDEVAEPFRAEYRDCWYTLFTPVRPIVLMIEYQLETLDLYPESFAAVHLEVAYTQEVMGRDPTLVANWTKNALNCGSNVRPDGPFLFLSDSDYAKSVALEYGKEKGATVVSRMNGDDNENLHSDLKHSTTTGRPSDYFPVFVDLYLLSLAKCYAYNVGGLAKWANHISGRNYGCNVRHWTPGVNLLSANKNGCSWKRGSGSVTSGSRRGRKARDLFVLPMTPVAVEAGDTS